MNSINNILKGVLKDINPNKEEINSIKKFVKNFVYELGKKFDKNKINAEVFVGGSFAKETIINKGQYDIDIFIRFDKRYKDEDISKLTLRVLKETEKYRKIVLIHGSRDYFRININSSFFLEIVPVIKVKNPKEAGNITDLSYFHVNYIKKRLKTEKMLEQVRLAKAFCYATKCYGAESYINGFSGYALELLIYHYKSFLGFIKGIMKIKGREIIDIEKLYKNKYEISMNMNSSKMNSPIILIDPTYKERNALAALSNETFRKFREEGEKFMKNPKKEAFEIKTINLDKIKKNATKSKSEFILLNAETDKQEGDIAGSKLVKFFKHLSMEMEKSYTIKEKGFNYNGEKEAEYFFIVKPKEKIIQNGPNLKDKKNVSIFKKHHKKTFIKKGRIYSEEKIDKNILEFIKKWKSENYEKMNAMHIKNLNIINF